MNLSQINRLVPQYNYRSTLSQPANPLDVWTLADYRGANSVPGFRLYERRISISEHAQFDRYGH